jgi:hypothetical protein
MKIPERIVIWTLHCRAFQVPGKPFGNAAQNVLTKFVEGPFDDLTDRVAFSGMDETWEPPRELLIAHEPLTIYRLDRFYLDSAHSQLLSLCVYRYLYPSEKAENFEPTCIVVAR